MLTRKEEMLVIELLQEAVERRQAPFDVETCQSALSKMTEMAKMNETADAKHAAETAIKKAAEEKFERICSESPAMSVEMLIVALRQNRELGSTRAFNLWVRNHSHEIGELVKLSGVEREARIEAAKNEMRAEFETMLAKLPLEAREKIEAIFDRKEN